MSDKKYMGNSDLQILKTQLKSLANVLSKFQLDHADIANSVIAQEKQAKKLRFEKQKKKFKLTEADIVNMIENLINDWHLELDDCDDESGTYTKHNYLLDNHGEGLTQVKNIVNKCKQDLLDLCLPWAN